MGRRPVRSMSTFWSNLYLHRQDRWLAQLFYLEEGGNSFDTSAVTLHTAVVFTVSATRTSNSVWIQQVPTFHRTSISWNTPMWHSSLIHHEMRRVCMSAFTFNFSQEMISWKLRLTEGTPQGQFRQPYHEIRHVYSTGNKFLYIPIARPKWRSRISTTFWDIGPKGRTEHIASILRVE
jgi:hypothetical protein